jgi:hypothetical protein
MRTDRPKSRAGLTLVRLLLVITLIAVSVCLLSPAIKQAIRRSAAFNSLKDQALAVASYLGAFGDVSSAFGSPRGTRLPWQKQTSPYLDHQGLSDGYGGQPPTSSALPWQKPTSPYLDHQGL